MLDFATIFFIVGNSTVLWIIRELMNLGVKIDNKFYTAVHLIAIGSIIVCACAPTVYNWINVSVLIVEMIHLNYNKFVQFGEE